MAEGFEPYHVPQQSRRDKLRFAAHHNDHNLQSLLHPLYDPSLLPSHFMIHGCPVKDEAVNLMGSVSSSAAAAHYLDPHADSHPLVNPSSIHDINSAGNEPFLYNPRDFDHSSYNAHEVFVFKPEPLSLSLSSHNTRHHPLELNLQRHGAGYAAPGIVGGGASGSASDDVSRSSAPLGPFTGYASILKGSRFLKPAQQLLEEFCDVGHVICAEKFAAASSLMEQNPPPLESLTGGGGDDPRSSSDGSSANQRKKSTLISMLDEVYRRYKQYYQQMQAVAASFECVSGLGNAAPYANQALKTMSKHFKCLKDAISDQLQFTNKGHGKEEAARFGNTDKGFYSQRAVNNSGYVESQPVWRPQRGLPERAVTVLRAWLFEHFLHPYPTDTDKQMLAKQTGLSRSQVSNWFINARVRLWKPMVEEIHMLETRQAHKGFPREGGGNNSGPSDHLKPVNTDLSENPSSSQRLQDGGPVRMAEPVNLAYNGMVGHGSSSVSLTLGLHQNNCIGLSEPFPIHAAQRFGLSLEGNSDGYVMGGFEAQHGHFGREGVGGQLLHDFVG